MTSSVNPAQFYQGVAFTATVTSTGGTPTGTVTFFNGTAQLGVATLSGGKASLGPMTLQSGEPLDHGHLLGGHRFCVEHVAGLYRDGGQGDHRYHAEVRTESVHVRR